MLLTIFYFAVMLFCFLCALLMAFCAVVVHRFKWVCALLVVMCGVFTAMGCAVCPI